ncbi:hypothetical protein GYMLUDRAFT_260278 [Collybiopsis luxurians FD-317 M1]|uniref:Uncharacterized protein n=1 Tax=Collybiopsis luxurians FD-317 M1 TaxID=944289 RepID=A0A0D0D0P0_9AGAR|nr:hypothetical protein GYMLUDRAFT_260278 [Collybiopsis luxurians FD-317 M1]
MLCMRFLKQHLGNNSGSSFICLAVILIVEKGDERFSSVLIPQLPDRIHSIFLCRCFGHTRSFSFSVIFFFPFPTDMMLWDQPIITLTLGALVLSVTHRSLAAPAPGDFTFVAQETDIPILIGPDTITGSHITTIVIPTRTYSSKEEQIYHELGINISTIVIPPRTSSGARPTTTYSSREEQIYHELGINISTIVIPPRTFSGARPANTYLYKEIQEYPGRTANTGHLTTETFTVSGLSTVPLLHLVVEVNPLALLASAGTPGASASGYILSAFSPGGPKRMERRHRMPLYQPH